MYRIQIIENNCCESPLNRLSQIMTRVSMRVPDMMAYTITRETVRAWDAGECNPLPADCFVCTDSTDELLAMAIRRSNAFAVPLVATAITGQEQLLKDIEPYGLAIGSEILGTKDSETKDALTVLASAKYAAQQQSLGERGMHDIETVKGSIQPLSFAPQLSYQTDICFCGVNH